MEEIIKSVVKLTKLTNSIDPNHNLADDPAIAKRSLLQISQDDPLEPHKKRNAQKIFGQIIEVNKYVNPINSKTLEEMRKSTVVTFNREENNTQKKVKKLYADLILQTTDDLLEMSDRYID